MFFIVANFTVAGVLLIIGILTLQKVSQLHEYVFASLPLQSIEMNSQGVRLAANEVELAFELLPLARRQLNIDSLTVERLQLEISETTGSEAQSRGGPFSLPIDITLRSSSLRNITFARGDLQRAIDSIEVSGDFEGNALQLAGLAVRSDWLDLDLGELGAVQSNIRLTGSLDKPVIEAFKLTTSSDEGLTVNINGRLNL